MHKTPRDIIAKKAAGKKISASVNICIWVIVLGYDNTIPVTMTQMQIFTEAVSRARENALVVGDRESVV